MKNDAVVKPYSLTIIARLL